MRSYGFFGIPVETIVGRALQPMVPVKSRWPASSLQGPLPLNAWDWTQLFPRIIGNAVASANTALAGPTTGGPAVATFRQLVPADITPALNAMGGLTGTF